MQNQIIIDPHTQDGRKETWTLSFRHYAFHPADARPSIRPPYRVGILFEANKEGRTPAEDENVLIGTASFLPGQKPEVIKLTTHPDAGDFVPALVAEGLAKHVGETVERHQDYPGEEIEEFRYHKLDVTDYYNRYIWDRRQWAMDSPLSHVSLCQGQVSNGRDPQDYIKCRIGGIEQKPVWAGFEARRLFQVADLYPECRFHLHELAQGSFAAQLQLYRDAQRCVTEFTKLFNNGTHYIRCKIDGVQQMTKEVGTLDICDYIQDKDAAALVAKYYSKELTAGINSAVSRSR